MQKNLLLAAAAAILPLSACNSAPETVNTYDAQAAELANAAPVELPPAITASRTFRCSDNSLVYVDYYNNDTAMVRTGSREAAPTTVTAAGGNPPYTAEGYSVSANAENVRITAPGKNDLSCRTG